MDLEIFWIIVLSLSVILTIIAADISKKKGCNYGIVILLGIFFTPIVALIVALAMSPNSDKIDQKKIDSGDHKRCVNCAEIIKKEAIVCRYCGGKIQNDGQQAV